MGIEGYGYLLGHMRDSNVKGNVDGHAHVWCPIKERATKLKRIKQVLRHPKDV